MRFNLNEMKKIIIACFFLCITVFSYAQTPTLGDYRSVASTNWSTLSTWQVRDGAGNWGPVSTAPLSTNNVYIQAGTTVTVDVAGVCNDLHVNNTSGSLVIGANTVSVSGKLRAYTGTAILTSIDDVFYTQTPVATGLGASLLVTTTTGALRFVGATRTIIANTDWGSNGTGNLGFVEFSLDAGAIGTLVQGIKSKKIRISSGIVSAGSSNTMVTGTAATDSFVVKTGAKFTTARTGNNAIGNSSTTTCALIVIEANATMEFTANAQLDTKSFINNGTVIYSGAAQNLVVSRSLSLAGADSLNNYVNLVLSGTGAKTIFSGGTVTVSDTLKLEGTNAAILTFGAGVGSKLTYGANATLVFNSSSATSTLLQSSIEWPATGGPKNIEIRRNKVQFCNCTGASRTITGSLILNGGVFNITQGDSLTMANNSNLIIKATTNNAFAYTSGTPGFYIIGAVPGDLVNVIINANGTVTENKELNPQVSYGRINLTIGAGTTYISSGRTVYNFINDGLLVFPVPTGSSGTSSFTIKGNISGAGTITGQDSVNITIDSSHTGSTQILKFTTGSSRIRNLVFDRVGGTLTSTGPLTIQRSLSLKNGIFNDAGFVDTVKGSILRGTTITSSHISGVGGKIVAAAKALDSTQRSIDSLSFGNLEIAGNYTCGGLTVTGDMTLASDTANCNSNTMLVYGNIFGTGVQSGAGRVQMVGSNKTVSGATFSSLEIASAGTITATGTTKINTDLFLTSGTFNDGGKIISVDGNIQGSGTHIGLGRLKMTGSAKSIIGGTLINNIEIAPGASISSTSPALGCSAFISGLLTMNGGNLGIGSGNTLTMKNGSSIYRTTGNLNLNTGTMAMGESATDTIAVTINGNLQSSNELPGSPVGKIDLTINDGFTYTLKSNNKTVRNLYLNSGQLETDPADLPLIYGITSTGTTTILGDYLLNAGLNIKNVLKFDDNVSAKTLNANGFLTFKSTASTTGSLAQVANGNNIIGNAITERYVQNKKAWRLLYMPTKHDYQNIKDAWQEEAIDSSLNNNPGYGIQITGGTFAAWKDSGFDKQTGNPSVKTYNSNSNNWEGISSTLVHFDTAKAYMTFVRGDRTVTNFNQSPTATVLREKGRVNIGDVAWNNLGTAGNQFVAIGNPYPSAISLSNISSNNIDNSFYTWDPLLTGNNGYGAFQTMSVSGGIVSIAPNIGGSYVSGNKNIESGQGFFVHTNTGVGSIVFHESNKATGSNLVSRAPSQLSSIRTNLFKSINNQYALMDGVLNIYDAGFSNDVDAADAKKLMNPSENLGIKQGVQLLAIERKAAIGINDTIFYNLSQMKLGNYKFDITPEYLDVVNLSGYLIDRFNQVSYPVSLTNPTIVNFDITTDTGSSAPNRFVLVFNYLRTTPVYFLNVKASLINKDILVEWQTENELDIKEYKVEKSTDGIHFVEAASLLGTNAGNYSWLDRQLAKGVNYYRIKSVGLTGDVAYSKIVKVLILGDVPGVTISPNPIEQDKLLNLYLCQLPFGAYQLTLFDLAGRKIFTKNWMHQINENKLAIKLPKSLLTGVYNLILVNDAQLKIVEKILIR